jgi:hypothetical protein
MGGYGSGKWYRHGTKTTCDSLRFIDVNRWNREKLLTERLYFGWSWKDTEGNEVASIGVSVQPRESVQIKYTINKKYPVSLLVRLDWTECNYGGKRPWFICPGKGCGRRVGKLYLCGKYFLCRFCHDLTYASCNENHDLTLKTVAKVERIRRKLGSSERGMRAPIPEKPKGMHWKTYHRLVKELRDAQYAADLAYLDETKRMLRRLANLPSLGLDKDME